MGTQASAKTHWGGLAQFFVAMLAVSLVWSTLLTTPRAVAASGSSTAVLDQLAATYKAQQAALTQRQQLELARLGAFWATKANDRQAAGAADQAAITAAMSGAVAPIVAKRDADLAAIEAARSPALAPIPAKYDAKRADRNAFIASMAAQLGPHPHPLPYDKALLVQQQLQAQLQLEQQALDAQQKLDLAPANTALSNAQAQRATLRSSVVGDQNATKAQIYSRYDAQYAARVQRYKDAVSALDGEQTQIDADYAAIVADLKQLATTELTQAKASGAGSTALSTLKTTQSARSAQASALYKVQSSSISTSLKAESIAEKTDLTTLSTAQNAEISALKQDGADQLRQFDANTNALLLPLRQAIKDIQARYKERKSDLKVAYDVKIAVAIRDSYNFSLSATAMLAVVDSEQLDAVSNVNNYYDAQHDVVIAQASATVALTQAPYLRKQSASAAQTKLDISNLQVDGSAAKAVLQRKQAREQLLLADEYDALKARTTSYLADGNSSLTAMGTYYNPGTDAGSLYNVEKGLGIDDRAPTGQGVKVALIDTGVVDVDGLSQANVTVGPDFSFEDMNVDTRGHDTNGHGTHLAGIIAGRDDAWVAGDHTRSASRFLGIAPDAQLLSIKAGTADGTTDVTQVIAAINWVIRYNETAAPSDRVRVINLSYGTDSQQDYSVDPLSYAAERAWKAGIVVVVAAGNDGWDADRLTDPASDPYVIAVGAGEGTGNKSVTADYSSEGSQDRTVDFVAPGRSIVSLRNPGSWSDQFNTAGRADERFVRGSGTSQAAAVVTGSVALLLQQRPDLTPDQVKALLEASATQLSSSDPRVSGAGALNVGRALGTRTIYSWQTFAPSNGSGSLEASRGTSHVLADDGTAFTGEQDVFGMNYSSSGWADDSWSGSQWRGSRWSGSSWSGSRWSDIGWTGSRWSGSRWSASRWSGSSWSGSRWSGSRWTGSRWSGSRWSGFSDL